MSELEREGYLTHPHTSAGRIPTDKGYRYYIENIMQNIGLTRREEEAVEDLCRSRYEGFDDFARDLSGLISDLTEQVAFVSPPQFEEGRLKSLRLFSISQDRLIAALITESNIVREKIIRVSEVASRMNLEGISRFINSECAGRQLGEIADFLKRRLLSETDSLYLLCRDALEIFELSNIIQQENRIFLKGSSYLLRKPEFQDMHVTRQLFEFLEGKPAFLKLVRVGLGVSGLNIRIGRENSFKPMHKCAFLSASYALGGRLRGSLGVIGPVRMEYAKAIGIMERVVKEIGHGSQ